MRDAPIENGIIPFKLLPIIIIKSDNKIKKSPRKKVTGFLGFNVTPYIL